MPAPFNIVAQLQLTGPTNLGAIVNTIKSALGSINANVNLQLTGSTVSRMTQVNAQLVQMSANLANVTTNANSAASAIQSMVSALNNASNASKGIQVNASNLNGVHRAAQQATQGMEEFGRVSALAVRRFAAFSIPAGFLVGAITGFRQIIQAGVEYDRQMNRLQQVTLASKETISSISGEIARLATGMGVASKSLSEVSVVLASAGYTAKEVKTALETLAQTQLGSQFDDIKSSTDGVIAVMQQFKIQAGDLNKVFSEMTSVARNFAVESRDIVVAIQHTGGAMKAAGGSVEELMAIFTAVRSTTRESAESIATGLRTILTRIERPRTIEYMRQLGVELQDINGKFVGPYEAIRRLGEAMKNLDTRDVRYAQVVEQLGGYRQVSKVIPALQETATMQKALATAQGGANALTQEAAISQEALSTKLTKVREEWLKLGREIVESKGFKMMAESAMSFATALTSVLRALQPVLPLITTLAAVKGVSGLASFVPGFAKGLKFARGGTVPGSGDGDTVPAMLEPGEFVMRKKAVQAIGESNLHKLNRYANGGIVQLDAVALTNSSGVANVSERFKNYQELLGKGINKPLKAQLGKFKLKKDQTKELFGPEIGYNFTVHTLKKGLDGTDVAEQFKEDVRSGMLGMIRTGGMKIAKAIRGGTTLSADANAIGQKTLTKIGINSIIGSAFEGSAHMLGAPFKKTSGANDTLDFPVGMGLAGDLFTPAIKGGRGAEAKYDVNSDMIKSLMRKGRRHLVERAVERAQSAEDVEAKADTRSILTKYQSSDSNTQSFLRNMRDKMNARSRNVLTQKQLDKLAELNINPDELKSTALTLKKMAKGGGADGTDTVPAMLTPGEFVLNKRAVSHIGKNNLDQMNQIEKFATGGMVGNVGTGAGATMFGIAGISGLAQSFLGIESSAGKAVQKLTEFAFTLEGVRMGMGMLQGMTQGVMGATVSKQAREGWAQIGIGLSGKRVVHGVPYDLSMFNETTVPGKGRVFRSRMSYLKSGLSDLGVNTGQLAAASAGLLGAGLMYAGSSYDANAIKLAEQSGGDQSKLRGAESSARTGNMLTGAGIGLSAGAAIGSAILPGIGTVVGAALGGVFGSLVGALRDNTSAVRDTAVGIRAAKGAEMTNDALGRLAAGKSYNKDLDRAVAMRGIEEQFAALSDTNKTDNAELRNKRIDSVYQALKGQASNIDQLRTPMIQKSKTMDEFDKQIGAATLVKSLSIMQGVSINDVRAQIEKDINAFAIHTKIVRDSALAFAKVDATMIILDKFAAAVENAAETTKKSTQSVGVYAGMGTGQYGQGWLPQTSNILQYAMRDAVNAKPDQIKNEVGSILAVTGIYGEGMKKDAVGSVEIMRRLPNILREAVAQAKVDAGGQDIITFVRQALEKEFKDNPLLDVIETNIGNQISSNREGGGQEFARQVNENANKVTQTLGGEGVNSILKPLDEMQKVLVQEAEKLATNLRTYDSVLMEATKRKVDLVRLESGNQRQALETRARLGGSTITYNQMTQGFWEAQDTLVSGTGAGRDAASINRELRSTQEQMESYKGAMQDKDLKVSGPAQLAFDGLKNKAQRLEQALQNLVSSTELLHAAQAKLEEATRTRDTKRSFITSYVMGDMDQKMNTIYGIKAIQSINNGEMDMRHMPPHFVSAINQIVSHFSDTKLPSLFGTQKNPVTGEEEGLTGMQWQDRINRQYTGQILRPDGVPDVGDVYKKEASVELTPEQTKYINEIKRINDEQVAALQFLQKIPDDMATKIKTGIEEGLKTFTQRLGESVSAGRVSAAKAKAEDEMGRLTSELNHRDKAYSLADTMERRFGKDIYGGETDDTKRKEIGFKLAQRFADEKTVKLFKENRQLSDFLYGDGGLPFHTGDRISTTAGMTDLEQSLSRFVHSKKGVSGDSTQYRVDAGKWFDEAIGGRLEGIINPNVLIEHRKHFVTQLQDNSGWGGSREDNTYARGSKALAEMMEELDKTRKHNQTNFMDSVGIPQDTAARDSFWREASNFVGDGSGKVYKDFAEMAQSVANLDLSQVNREIGRLTESLSSIGESVGKVTPAGAQAIEDLAIAISMYGESKSLPLTARGVPKENIVDPEKLATGGSIFKPQGTDTVPAMLTPGEFVVRRDMAQKHKGLLQAINNNTLYAAGGAEVTPVYDAMTWMMGLSDEDMDRLPHSEEYRRDVAAMRAAASKPSKPRSSMFGLGLSAAQNTLSNIVGPRSSIATGVDAEVRRLKTEGVTAYLAKPIDATPLKPVGAPSKGRPYRPSPAAPEPLTAFEAERQKRRAEYQNRKWRIYKPKTERDSAADFVASNRKKATEGMMGHYGGRALNWISNNVFGRGNVVDEDKIVADRQKMEKGERDSTLTPKQTRMFRSVDRLEQEKADAIERERNYATRHRGYRSREDSITKTWDSRINKLRNAASIKEEVKARAVEKPEGDLDPEEFFLDKKPGATPKSVVPTFNKTPFQVFKEERDKREKAAREEAEKAGMTVDTYRRSQLLQQRRDVEDRQQAVKDQQAADEGMPINDFPVGDKFWYESDIQARRRELAVEDKARRSSLPGNARYTGIVDATQVGAFHRDEQGNVVEDKPKPVPESDPYLIRLDQNRLNESRIRFMRENPGFNPGDRFVMGADGKPEQFNGDAAGSQGTDKPIDVNGRRVFTVQPLYHNRDLPSIQRQVDSEYAAKDRDAAERTGINNANLSAVNNLGYSSAALSAMSVAEAKRMHELEVKHGMQSVVGSMDEPTQFTPAEQAAKSIQEEKERQEIQALNDRWGTSFIPAGMWRGGSVRGYASGGLVDSVPAMLTPGEFVLNRNATAMLGAANLQKFNDGGLVQYRAGGGAIPATASGGGGYELALSDAAAAAMKSMSEAMQAAATSIQGAMTSGSELLKATFDQAVSQFTGSINIMVESANTMKTSLESFATSVNNLKNIEVRVANIEALSNNASMLGGALSNFAQTTNSTVSSLNEVMQGLKGVAGELSGLVGSLKDKLQVTVTATHTVNVTVDGKVISTPDTATLGDLIKEPVSKIVQDALGKLQESGPHLAAG